MEQHPELRKTIGPAAATFTLVGFVIGVPIFTVPGEIVADTGPGMFLSFLIAGVIAAFSCVVAAQVGSVFPISGAGYIGISTVISPFWGFLLVWLIMVCMVVGLPVMAYGFADYLDQFVPGLPRKTMASLAVIVFGAINLLGVRAAVWVQALMVILLVAVLSIIGVGGIAHMNPALMHPLLPNGFGAILVSAIPAYFTYSGFMVIVEMGEEIDRPERTLPISLTASFLIILALYLLIAIALPGLIPWEEFKTIKAPVSAAAEIFMPKWFTRIIGLSALFGAVTAINAWFMTQTRDIYALARDGVLPKTLAHVSRKYGEPDAAIIFAICIALFGVSIAATATEYAIMVVLAISVIQVMSGIAILRAPSKVPEHFRRAPFKLGPAGRWFFGGGFILLSAGFGAVGLVQSHKATLVFLVLLAVGCVYYFFRKRHLQKLGVSIEAALRKDISKILEQ